MYVHKWMETYKDLTNDDHFSDTQCVFAKHIFRMPENSLHFLTIHDLQIQKIDAQPR